MFKLPVMTEFAPDPLVADKLLVVADGLTVPRERKVRLLEPVEPTLNDESNESGIEVPKELAVTKLTTLFEELGRFAIEPKRLMLAELGELAEDCIRLLGTDTALTIELGNSVFEIPAVDVEMMEDNVTDETNDGDN